MSGKAITTKSISKKKTFLSHLRQYYWLYVFMIPGLAALIIFRYLPMGGLIIAFEDYKITKGYFGSKWVGFDNFRLLFNSISFLRVLKNSLLTSSLQIICSFPVPIILSLMLNEMRVQSYKRTLQTILYLPHFISWVVVISMVTGLLGTSAGSIVNELIVRSGGEKIAFMTDPMYFRPIVIGSSIWKSSGWGTVVYLAALAGLDPTLYEAAIIDGANRFQRILYISFPCILGTISVMLILRLGNLMSNGFEQIWLLQNDLNKSTAEVLETYSYQVGLREGRYSYSAAVGMFQSLVSFLLIFSSNYISKKVGGDGLW
jgi:putative aldouronate transport system permease protein